MRWVFKPKEFDFAARFLIYGLDEKLSSCKTNVELSCLNWSNMGIINCINILA